MRRPAAEITGMVLWVPMLDGDTAAAAEEHAGVWQDQRVRHWWDGSTQVSQVFRQALGLQGPAWDLYLLYRPAASWEHDVPPVPAFWMHQLSHPGADQTHLLSGDPDGLGRELDDLLQE